MDSITILKVAIPSPLRRVFDYLPPKNNPLQNYAPGMRVLVPFGKRRLIGIVTDIAGHSDVDVHKLRPIIKCLDSQPTLSPSLLKLCAWATAYYHHAPGDVFQHALPLALRSEKATVEERLILWKPSQKGLLIDPAKLGRARKQIEALTSLREHPEGLHQKIIANLGITTAVLRTLAEKGLAERHEEQHTHTRWNTDNLLSETALTLNEQQQQALDAINQTSTFSTFLLEGVTGSGKTEVYLQALESVLREGKQALILVPEIGLTPQTLSRFKQRFCAPVLALHSGLNNTERLEAWRRGNDGSAAIIIGTRSALFTPLLNPGMIIIDEEHDLSYKQQAGFRYSARDLAIVRAKLENIPVILGSATPALESLYNAESGRFKLLRITQRAGNAKQPAFFISDLRKAELKNGLCAKLIDAIRKELDNNNQVLFFLNRRGYAPVLMCHDCGWSSKCIKCDARMTYHRNPAHLHCHHCDFQSQITKSCPDCGSTDLRAIGQGTERIDEQLSELFPKNRIVRIDRDTTQRKDSLNQQLKIIHEGKPCILVGTQMLAKGHHFPHVTLVAISDTDSGLFASDFRATEHTAQLILQVAGRAGRAEKPGKVILQTHNPDHPVLQTLMEQRYDKFAKLALSERKLTGLPPYSHIALIRAEAPHPDTGRDFLTLIQQFLETNAAQGVDAWGPVPALMLRKAGHYRHQLLLRSDERSPLHQSIDLLLNWLDAAPTNHKVRWSLDVDPVSLD